MILLHGVFVNQIECFLIYIFCYNLLFFIVYASCLFIIKTSPYIIWFSCASSAYRILFYSVFLRFKMILTFFASGSKTKRFSKNQTILLWKPNDSRKTKRFRSENQTISEKPNDFAFLSTILKTKRFFYSQKNKPGNRFPACHYITSFSFIISNFIPSFLFIYLYIFPLIL